MSEQFRSRVGDYNPETRMLTVHQKKDRSRPMVRYAPLGKVGAEAYAQLAKNRKKGSRLCLNTEGTPMTDVDYWFKPALKEAKIFDYHWHDNRHTACSRWVGRSAVGSREQVCRSRDGADDHAIYSSHAQCKRIRQQRR
jgi:hypothetical protein